MNRKPHIVVIDGSGNMRSQPQPKDFDPKGPLVMRDMAPPPRTVEVRRDFAKDAPTPGEMINPRDRK